jgi:hypothetical protein
MVSTITGARIFYAAGGGGGSDTVGFNGIGGTSNAGDGVGGATGNGISATANSGSGGGGSSRSGTGGSGGSGIVIIRYPANCAPPTSTTGNPQINYADGYQIYTWTSNGTVTF